MTDHAPGPWYVRGPLADWEAHKPGGVPVTVVDADGRDLLDDLTEANAHLMAAAPDLLEAAVFALKRPRSGQARAMLLAAIARAEGKA